MKIACYTDIHNQGCMLNMPTVLRSSAVKAAEQTIKEWSRADLAIIGGDNFSDYPYWNRSCALPYRNWLDIKAKLVANFARAAVDERVLYVSGNNDLILGDLPTADNPPYNTCDFYHTGPMNKTLGILAEDDYYGIYAKSKGKQAGIYHLAFHYEIDGIDFFGINIDPDTAFNNHDSFYNIKALKWLKNKINQVDPHGKKLIFVVGHLSATVRKNGKIVEDMDEINRSALYDAFAGHQNLFYLYGHVHGQAYLHTDTADGIINNRGFYTVHMGGLRPFTSPKPFEYFEDDGLTGMVPGEKEATFCEATGTPKIAQYLLIETYNEKVIFSYRNAGTLPGFTSADIPQPCVIWLQA